MIRAADRHVPQVAVPLTGNYDDDEENAIEGGYVRAGSDKLALPRMRMSYGATVDRLAYVIG